jgi:hypothetical protein
LNLFFKRNYFIFDYREFQFGYTDTTDLLNNVAIWSLEGPLLFVLNSTNYKFSLVYFDRVNLPGNNEIDSVIQDIRDLKLEVKKERNEIKKYLLNFYF